VFKVKLAVTVFTAIAAAGVLAAANASGAHRVGSFSYLVRSAGTEYLTRAGVSATFPGRLETGDQIFGRDVLMRGGSKIGYDNETCTVTFDGNDLCHVLAVFPAVGDVEATWLWVGRNTTHYGPSHFAGVIDGGTGRYANAGGQFEAFALPDGTLRITTTLR